MNTKVLPPYLKQNQIILSQVAKEARAAGERRKQLAVAVASTSASSGSSGKRSHRSVAPTNSTKVTPEAKQPCASVEPVEPRSLAMKFEAVETQGGV